MRCYGNAIHRIKEYLNGQLIETCDDGSAIMEIHIVEKEQWWKKCIRNYRRENPKRKKDKLWKINLFIVL